MWLWDQFQRPTGYRGKIIATMMNRGHKELTKWGLTHITIQPNYVVLDVGCGGGKTVNRLAQIATKGKVYGIDHSADMVEYAKKLNNKFVKESKVEIHEASVDKTKFPNSTFDLVTAVETYYFWPNLPGAFKEINRILKPKGRLLIVNEMVKDGFYDVENASLIEKVNVKLFSLDKIRRLLEAAGFSVEVHRKENSPWNALVAEKTPI
jgi:ubiquinone/menaquinone biosynthesis C-methylase UbiE